MEPEPPETAAPPAELHAFPAFVRQVLDQWQAPGLAVAVARDGEIVLAQGFGLRDVARGLPVTPRTLFAIGSATKAFTTMSLGLLADEGKLDWDTPVKTYLPTFKLHDPFATERMTPRDLVTHRSGLPRHDLMWYGSGLTRPEIVERLQYLEPNKDFRAVWQYQNLMYLVAGYLAGEIAGVEWEALVQERIFDRLGMTGSNFSAERAQAAADCARPYQEKDGTVNELPFRSLDEVGPAGSINSNLTDMSQWLLLHLYKGKHRGEPFISEGQIAQMHTPQMVVPAPGKYAELAPPSYGLGWGVQSYRGHAVVHHGGNIDGFSALVSFMPRERIGVIALTNLDGVPVPDIVAFHVYDRLLGLDEIPWNERFLEERSAVKAAGEVSKAHEEAERVPDTHPSHPLDAYAGEYAHPGYGTIVIAQEGDTLALRHGTFAGPLRHRHYDTFEFNVELVDLRIPLTFATDAKGEIASIAAPLEPAVADIVFTRQPPRAMTEMAFLERFVGTYELMGMTLSVALKDPHTLQIVLPGQQIHELEPHQGTTFRRKGVSGFSIEFKKDAAGAVTEAVVTQPGAVFTARRMA